MHLSQKENNPGISAFKLLANVALVSSHKASLKNFFFLNDEYSSYLLKGIDLNLLLLLRM